jgi:Fe-S-cluster containining protein
MKNRGAEEHGLPIKADGSCGYLIGDLCSIYKNRPDCCNVDITGQRLVKSGKFKSMNDWYRFTTSECHKLINQAGLDDKYKINLKVYDSKTNKNNSGNSDDLSC